MATDGGQHRPDREPEPGVVPDPETGPEPGTGPRNPEEAEHGPSRLKPVVFYGSSVLIVALSVWAIAAPAHAGNSIGAVVTWISEVFGWYYFLATTLYLGFVVVICLSGVDTPSSRAGKNTPSPFS